jgi:putative Flp pilus-assembly TadE/G-like protein
VVLCERGQMLVLLAGAAVMLLLFVGVLGALGKALLGRGRLQRAADLAAVSAARSMQDDFPRLFDRSSHGLSKAAYLERARAAAIVAARSNGAALDAGDSVAFPDRRSFAPTRVRVSIHAGVAVREGEAVPARASAEAEIGGTGGVLPVEAEGGGYSGPLAYRQGKATC